MRKGQRPAAFQLQRHEQNSTREGVPQVLVRWRGRERTEEAFRNSKAISCLAENISVIGLHSNFWVVIRKSFATHLRLVLSIEEPISLLCSTYWGMLEFR